MSNNKLNSSFPLSLFIDKQSEIDIKMNEVKKWVDNFDKKLDNFLIKNKYVTNKNKLNINNSNILFTYDLKENENLPNFYSLEESINDIFNIKNCSAYIKKGQLLVVIPLPENLSLPVNIPPMYKYSFG